MAPPSSRPVADSYSLILFFISSSPNLVTLCLTLGISANASAEWAECSAIGILAFRCLCGPWPRKEHVYVLVPLPQRYLSLPRAQHTSCLHLTFRLQLVCMLQYEVVALNLCLWLRSSFMDIDPQGYRKIPRFLRTGQCPIIAPTTPICERIEEAIFRLLNFDVTSY